MKNDYSCGGGGTTAIQATSVSVYPFCTTLRVGEWFYGASATVYPSNATNKDVTWSSSNAGVAAVNASSGYIYARSAGTASIYATAADGSGKRGYIAVTVTSGTILVDSVELNRTSISLNKGDTFSLAAVVCPENATNRSLTWSSSNTGVAAVDGGYVTAVAKGAAVVTASALDGSGCSASCTVYVNDNVQVSSVAIEPESKIMKIGESAYLSAVVLPADASNPCLFWTSSDTNVVTVNSDSGLILAKSVGTATVYATAQDGSKQKGSCLITVKASIPAEAIGICPSSVTLQIGKSMRLNAVLSPANATDGITWRSEFPEIASVDAMGNVVTHAAGTTRIYAAAGDSEPKTAYCTVGVVVAFDGNSYYINNQYTGKFMGCGAGRLMRDTYQLGDSQKWKLDSVGNDQYVMRVYGNLDIVVYADEGSAAVGTAPSSLTDEYKWKIFSADGGGVVIQNVGNHMILYDNGDQICLTNEEESGMIREEAKSWRIAACASYVEMQSFTVGPMTLDRTESGTPALSVSPANSTWTTAADFLYTANAPNVEIDNEHHTIKGIASGTVQVTATHKCSGYSATFSVKVNKNAVIIIPGIFGSELYCGEGNPHFAEGEALISTEMVDRLSAELSGISDLSSVIGLAGYADALYESLECRSNGASRYNVYTKKYKPVLSATDSREAYTVYCGIKDYYKPLYDAFNDNSGIKAKYEVEFFSYDWRLSNAYSAARLNAFINEAGYDKVVMVAHSMGGLVASGYLALGESQRSKVQNVFYLASPLLGCAEIVNIWYNLDFSALNETIAPYVGWINRVLSLVTVTTDPIRKLACNFPSIYELMPSEKYFTLAGKHYLTESNDITGKIQVHDTYSSTMSLVSDILPHFNQSLMTSAEAFHDSLYCSDGLHISGLTDSYYLYGTGIETRMMYDYHTSISLSSSPSSPIEIEYSLSLNYESAEIGDRLVAKWSAALGGNVAYSDKIYRCPGNRHMAIMNNNGNVYAFMRRLILKNYIYKKEDNFIKGYE